MRTRGSFSSLQHDSWRFVPILEGGGGSGTLNLQYKRL